MPAVNIPQSLAAAIAHHNSGRLTEAQNLYAQILAVDPTHADALRLLSIALGQQGNWNASIAAAQSAVGANPASAESHNLLVYSLAGAGRWQDAAAAARQATRLAPGNSQSWHYFAAALRELRQFDEAAAAIDRALALNPSDPEAHCTRARLLCDQKKYAEGIASCRRALDLRPEYAQALNYLGRALAESSRPAEAVDVYRRLILQSPHSPEALSNLGNALAALGRIDESIASYQAALQRNPNYPLAHFNLGLRYLSLGDFQRGWPEYEYRFQIADFGQRPNLNLPRWRGDDLNGKRILLFAEQGHGDVIQFIRYLPMIAQRGGKAVLLAPPRLKRLLEKLDYLEQFAPFDQPVPDCDFQCPLLSLPWIFGTTLQTIPATVPYLKADPNDSALWQSRFSADGKKKIGLVWAGNPQHAHDFERSIPLAALAPLAGVSGAMFVSLQKGDPAGAAAGAPIPLLDWTNDFHDFADTAALIGNLDLVIAVDTAVAHLAGALAKPVWLLLKFAPEWRWMRNRDDSPWYPTMRLFRQPAIGDWATPLSRIVHALHKDDGVSG